VSESQSPSPLATGVILGAFAGLLAGYADIASTIFWLAPGADRPWLVVVFLTVGLATGALAGALVGALDAILSHWTARVFVRHAVVLAAPLALVAHLLFAGGKMRRLPAQWALKPLVALALVALVAWALAALRRLVVSVSERPRRVRFVFGGASLIVGWLLHGLDHRVLPRLYEYLHAGLGAMTALAFAIGVALMAPSLWREASTRRTRLAWACGALALVAVPLSARWLDARPNVRAEVFGTHAPFVRHACLAVATVTAAPEGRTVDSAALRRARLARDQAAQSAATDGLPRATGAHLLLVTVDALRADRLGRVVNGRSLTPTLDALAARGVVFERAYTQAPHSSYSLSSLHSGEYLHETVPLGQPQPLTTLAAAVRADGRLTAALYTRGIFFTEGERLYPYRDADFGFARSAHVDRDADAQTEAATRELDDIVRRGEAPSFLWVHYFDAHAPYQGRGATAEAQYDDAVARIDRALGRLVEHTRRALARDAVIAVTADHGEEFGEHGGVYHGSALYDEQVRVPLVIAAPGVAPRRVSTPVELVDLAPTLAGLVGLSRPPSMHGRDLRAWMTDGPAPAATPVFAAVNTRKMVLAWPWKLIADLSYGVDELYDLASDPHERRNLAGSDPARCAAMRADLAAWLESLAERSGGAGPLARARLGDRGSVPDLVTLALDRRATTAARVEAIDLLAGLADRSSVAALRPLLRDGSGDVRAVAAIALGAAGDTNARASLVDLLASDPPRLRQRAALALSQLGDARAVEGLVEALWSNEENAALEAIKALGRLGDPRAIEPLLAVLPDDHVRYRVVLALGQLRDAGLFSTLAEIARHDPTDDARANAIAALGRLGDRRAEALLRASITLARTERYAAEALGALGAVGDTVDGFDARQMRGRAPPIGFARCGAHEDSLGWRYLGAESCMTEPTTSRATLTFRVRSSANRMLVLRVRRDDGPPAEVALRIGSREVARVTVTPRWEEPRIVLDAMPVGEVEFVFDTSVSGSPLVLSVGHALALPPG
jgi:arylsulfatase A-like enzyme/HEAT repeat protein